MLSCIFPRTTLTNPLRSQMNLLLSVSCVCVCVGGREPSEGRICSHQEKMSHPLESKCAWKLQYITANQREEKIHTQILIFSLISLFVNVGCQCERSSRLRAGGTTHRDLTDVFSLPLKLTYLLTVYLTTL